MEDEKRTAGEPVDVRPGSAEKRVASGGTPPRGGAVATATPQPPSRPRRKGRRIALILVLLVCLGALGIAGWFYLERTNSQREALERLDEATARVEAAAVVVLDLDEIVRAAIEPELAERALDVAERVPGAVEDLETAIELIDGAREDLPAADVAYALALRDSATTRLEMLEFGGPILQADGKVSSARTPAEAAWELVREIEEISNEAAEEYGKLTREGVGRSTELADTALGKVGEARELFSEAATAFPEVDFEPYLAYCDKRDEALGISKQADAAWLDGRIAEANTLGTQYNALQQELTSMLEELPSTPVAPIRRAFEEIAGDAYAAYLEARARATVADARVRQITGQPEPQAEEPEEDAEPEPQAEEPEPEPDGGTE